MNIDNKRNLLSNFVSLSLLQVFSYILPLITLPYLVKVLGVERFGQVIFAQSFVLFFHVLVDFGLNLTATRNISVHRDDPSKVSEIFSSVLLIRLLLLIASMILFSVLVFSVHRFNSEWQLYFMSFLWVLGSALFPVWFFQGVERMIYITVITMLTRLFSTLMIFVVVKDAGDYLYVPLANGVGILSASIVSLWIIYYKFEYQLALVPVEVVKNYFKESLPYFMSRMSVAIYASSSVFVLGLFVGNTAVTQYSVAEKFYNALKGVYEPLAQALYPYISRRRDTILFRKIFVVAYVACIILVVILFFEADWLYELFFSNLSGSESVDAFRVLLGAILLVVPSILLGYPFLGAMGYMQYANVSVMVASVLHIIGLVLLVTMGWLGVFSVAILVLFTQFIDLVYRLYGVKRYRLWTHVPTCRN